MKLSLVGPVYPYRGGISHFTTSLARAFHEQGFDIQVISFKRQYPKWLYPGESDLDPSTIHDSVAAEFILDPLKPGTWRKASQAIMLHGADIAIISWWTVFWGPAFYLLCRYLHRHGIKITFLIHNVLPHEEKPWDRSIAKIVLKQGDGFLVLTERERQRLVAMLGNHEKIHLSHLPIFDFNITEKPTKKQAREMLGIPIDIPVVLFFGIVRPYKGLNTLLESLAILNKSSRYYLLIAGEFWERKDDYVTLIRRLDLTNQVKIIDHYIPNEDLPALFSAADVFTAAYLAGTQSATTSMALGFGTRIVVSEPVARGIPEEYMDSIQVVPAGDPIALAHGIQQAYNDDRSEFISILDRKDWKDLVQALIDLSV